MNTEYKDADLGMEDSGVGSSCSSSVSDAQPEPLENLLDADGDDIQSNTSIHESDVEDSSLPFMQVSLNSNYLSDIFFRILVRDIIVRRF